MNRTPVCFLVLLLCACGGDGGGSPDAAFIPDGASPPDASLGPDAAYPAGPFGIGVTTRVFVDSSRPTPANGSAPASPQRSLRTDIYYPSTGDPNAADPVQDAPLAAGGPFPLVLFVHGSGSTRIVYTWLYKGLARIGYVVAAADFPLTAMSTPGGSSDLHVTDQVGDLSFLCDTLGTVSRDAGDALHGAVEGTRYAVVGHSTGGAVAELAAYAGDDAMITHDARVAAVVPLSGDACMFSASFFQSRAVPILVVGATNDLFVRVPNSGQWVFDNAMAPRLLLKLIGGQHMGFTDIGLPDAILNPVPTGPDSDLSKTLAAYGDASECLPEPAPGTDTQMTFERQREATVQVVGAYLDAQLRGRPAAIEALIATPPADLSFSQ